MKLKRFQRATVEHALRCLDRRGGSRRFLVADEVGLGKTLVAQGVIEGRCRAEGRQLNVFYVCSSLSIAHQNKDNLLEILPEASREAATVHIDRLTLLPLKGNASSPAGSAKPPFRLYTLTPGTMPGSRRTGRSNERALIYWLLREALGRAMGRGRAGVLSMRLRHGVRSDSSWERALERVEEKLGTPPARLVRAFRRQVALELELPARARSRTLAVTLIEKLREDPQEAIGQLRIALGKASVRNIEADLLVFDEFQRFFELVEGADEPQDEEHDKDSAARSLMRDLMSARDDKGPGPVTLLLSATPYRLYSGWREGESRQHQQEFFKLLAFLLGSSKGKLHKLERDFEEYALRLRSDPAGSTQVLETRDRIRRALSRVMCRTERAGDGGMQRSVRDAHLRPLDVRLLRHTHDSASPQHGWMAEPFWSSVPYPLQMMSRNDYVLSQHARRQPLHGPAAEAEIRFPAVRRYQRLSRPHPRLRALLDDVPPELLRLPWLPPSLPWWELGGCFHDAREVGRAATSKVLLFSRYRAVPRALAAVLSYEAERRSYGSSRYDYLDRRRTRSQMARFPAAKTLRQQPEPSFQFTTDGAAGQRHVPMFCPLPALAALGDPTTLTGFRSRSLTRTDALAQIRERLRERLGSAARPASGVRRWHWASELERRAHTLEATGEAWLDWLYDGGSEHGSVRRAAESFCGYPGTPARAAPTEGDLQELAEMALLGPAQVLLRATQRVFDDGVAEPTGALVQAQRGRMKGVLAASIEGLVGYLDTPEFHVLLSGSRRSHPAAIRRAVWDGNLESVLDEYLVTQQGLGVTSPPEGREQRALDALATALSIRASSINVQPLTKGARAVAMRCHAALPFGITAQEVVSEITGKLRTDFLRTAFNSPFRPYVLASTSIGQEGLDFHVYCDRIVHWDLPSNPVNLEQREGRVRRYGGLAVRRVLAERHRRLPANESPWKELGGRQQETRDGLSPWWMLEGAEVESIVYAPPFSRLRADLRQLQDGLSLYRLALGQPDQEALVTALRRRLDSEDEAALDAWFTKARLDLRPPKLRASRKHRGLGK